MIRIWSKIPACLLVLAIWVPSAAAFTGSYEEMITIGDKPIAHFRVYAKEKNVRTEFLMEAQSEIIIRNAEGTFRYSGEQKMALKLPDLVPPQQTLLDHLDDYLGFLQKNGAVNKGGEKVGDLETDIYEFLDPMTQKQAKAWVWREKSFPLKIEIEAPEGLLRVEMKDIQIAVPVDDALFALPEETKVIDLNEMYGPQAQANEEAADDSQTS